MGNRKVRKKRTDWPRRVRCGSTTVKVYQVRHRTGFLYTLAWYDGPKRRLQQFASPDQAITEARKKVHDLNEGRREMARVSQSDAELLAWAKLTLQPLGISLNQALSDYLDCREKLAGAPLTKAVDWYAQHHPQQDRNQTVPEVIEELLFSKAKDGASKRHLQDLDSRLNQFAAAFSVPINAIRSREIDDWLRNLSCAARTRNNTRRVIIILFRFAQSRGYLSRGIKTEAEHTSRAKEEATQIEIFTPEELGLLIAIAHQSEEPSALAYFAISGLAGLRHAEICRLDWSEVETTERHIWVKAAKAKTSQNRHVPLNDRLLQLLELIPRRHRQGQVCTQQQSRKARNLARRLLGKWPANALRHSYGSYRLAQIQDIQRVALEMGNSPQMIFQSYRKLVPLREANKWFETVSI